MKALVTGGAGFIGSHIVDKLFQCGYQNVVVVDNLSSGDEKQVSEDAAIYRLDIASPQLDYAFAMEHPDVVIHHAAQVSVPYSVSHPLQDAESNILGTINVLECCRKYDVRKIVYASTCAVYQDLGSESAKEDSTIQPISGYGLSKWTGERYIQLYAELYGLSYTILRYSNVYGPRQKSKGEAGIVPLFIEKMIAGKKPIIFGKGDQTRDYVYVTDVAKANVLALAQTGNDIFNISSNISTSVCEMYYLISSTLSFSMEPEYAPARKGEINAIRLDNSKAEECLGWRPEIDLRSGLQKSLQYYKENPH
jgi:UDP-glucose 4-epimerase